MPAFNINQKVGISNDVRHLTHGPAYSSAHLPHIQRSVELLLSQSNSHGNLRQGLLWPTLFTVQHMLLVQSFIQGTIREDPRSYGAALLSAGQ